MKVNHGPTNKGVGLDGSTILFFNFFLSLLQGDGIFMWEEIWNDGKWQAAGAAPTAR